MAKQTNTKQKSTKVVEEPEVKVEEKVQVQESVNTETNVETTELVEDKSQETVDPVEQENKDNETPDQETKENCGEDQTPDATSEGDDSEKPFETGEDAVNEEPIVRNCPAQQGVYQARPLQPKSNTAGAYVAQSPIRH